MNVCLLTETFYPVTGGGETQARVVASGLAESGFGVRLVTRRSDRSLPRQEVLGPVGVHRLPPAGSGQLKKWGLVLTAMLRLFGMRKDYDVLLVCGYRILGIPAVAVSRMLGKPCVLKADSLGELSGAFFDAGLARIRMRRTQWLPRKLLTLRNGLLLKASAFVAISTPVAEELIECGVPAARIIRIPNSVDTARFCPADADTKRALRTRLGLPLESRIFVYTGRLVTTKGLPMLLETWQRVAARHRRAHLLLVGEGGLGLQNCEAELRSFVHDHKLVDRVTFAGSVDNVQDYLRSSDCFVFPTEREAFGISVIEAMSCGLAIIATDVGGLVDILDAEQTAIVVPVRDGASMEAAIERVLRGEPGIREMTSRARMRAVESFSEQMVVGRYVELLTDLLQGRGEARIAG
jgi:glycosyltransferase involved in cell wall biosynthesis